MTALEHSAERTALCIPSNAVAVRFESDTLIANVTALEHSVERVALVRGSLRWIRSCAVAVAVRVLEHSADRVALVLGSLRWIRSK